MSGLAESRLLVASHIVPWGRDAANRLNPRNGLCLSALHDKAFDRGLITVSDDHKVVDSGVLKHKPDAFCKAVLLPLDGLPIEKPQRFLPTPDLLAYHREHVFFGR